MKTICLMCHGETLFKGMDLDAQKLVTQNARLSRLVRRMQEVKEKAT